MFYPKIKHEQKHSVKVNNINTYGRRKRNKFNVKGVMNSKVVNSNTPSPLVEIPTDAINLVFSKENPSKTKVKSDV